MQLRREIVRDFVNMLAKNECGLYDVRFNNAKEQKLKEKRRSVNEQNVSNNLPTHLKYQ